MNGRGLSVIHKAGGCDEESFASRTPPPPLLHLSPRTKHSVHVAPYVCHPSRPRHAFCVCHPSRTPVRGGSALSSRCDDAAAPTSPQSRHARRQRIAHTFRACYETPDFLLVEGW